MASPPASSKSSTVEPVISDEADRALRPWVIIGLPLALVCAFLLPLGSSILGAYFPKNHLISGPFGILPLSSAVLWMLPAYYIFTKVYNIRLDFGRKYVAEKRWKEAEAALGSSDQLILKFFDRTGEAHYLWAQALDGLGKKNAAEKARGFLRKRRPNSVYTAKLTTAVIGVSQIKKREASEAEPSHSAATGQLKKTKRRRF